jgi:hypothetical protein
MQKILGAAIKKMQAHLQVSYEFMRLYVDGNSSPERTGSRIKETDWGNAEEGIHEPCGRQSYAMGVRRAVESRHPCEGYNVINGTE